MKGPRSPLLRDPEQLQPRPSQTKASASEEPPPQRAEAPDPISQLAERAHPPASWGTLGPGRRQREGPPAGRARRAWAWGAPAGLGSPAGCRSPLAGSEAPPPRRRRRSPALPPGRAPRLPNGPTPSSPRVAPETPPLHRAARGVVSRSWNKRAAPAGVRSPSGPPSAGLQRHPSGCWALCPCRGGKGGGTPAHPAAAPALQSCRQLPYLPQRPVPQPREALIHSQGGADRRPRITLLLTSTALQS